MKINFGESEVIVISSEQQKALQYSELINCDIGSWPIKYLGVPVL
jgi:hypothetical protein